MDSSLSKSSILLLNIGRHLTVALIALFVIGGATRVMEAGLACPDWPLCYGVIFPGHQMNIQVFLEWFHRLDAFLVSSFIFFQFVLSIRNRSNLPKGITNIYFIMFLLVMFQAFLGALTVSHLLKSEVVTAHLLTAMGLIILSSLTNQKLQNNHLQKIPYGWKTLSFLSLIFLLLQSGLGGRLSSTWSAKLCFANESSCILLNTHKLFAYPVSAILLTFVLFAIWKGPIDKNKSLYLFSLILLLFSQVALGVFSIFSELNFPLITIGHQLNAALLIALVSNLFFMGVDDQFFALPLIRSAKSIGVST